MTCNMDKIKVAIFLFLIMNGCIFSQNTFKHKVVAGETLYAIARNNGVSVETIYELNPKLKGKSLQINTIVLLPIKNQETNATNSTAEKPSIHKVEKGESFYSISRKYNISVAALEALNPKINPKKLKKGTLLLIEKKNDIAIENEVLTEVEVAENNAVIPVEAEKESPTTIVKDSTFTTLHIIQPKETKYGISKKYGISIHELEMLNPSLPSDFPVGYELIIKKDSQIAENTSLSYDEEEKVEEMAKEFNSKADVLVEKASQYIGIKYKYGGTTPKGFDCSGLMCTTFKEIDLSLPRTSSAQANFGEKIKMKESQKGDLIFFATGRKNRISHVGLITEVNEDEIKFIHASTSSGVMISSSKEPYYASRIIQVNRVLNE